MLRTKLWKSNSEQYDAALACFSWWSGSLQTSFNQDRRWERRISFYHLFSARIVYSTWTCLWQSQSPSDSTSQPYPSPPGNRTTTQIRTQLKMWGTDKYFESVSSASTSALTECLSLKSLWVIVKNIFPMEKMNGILLRNPTVGIRGCLLSQVKRVSVRSCFQSFLSL